jgi:hypothetical protein
MGHPKRRTAAVLVGFSNVTWRVRRANKVVAMLTTVHRVDVTPTVTSVSSNVAPAAATRRS